MAATQHAQLIKQDSRDYLTTALLQLLETHDLATITVTQVVKRAGVSRMAFYRNFTTLSDVLTAYFDSLIAARFADVQQQLPVADKLMAISGFFSTQAAVLKLSVERGFEAIIRQCFDQQMLHFYADLVLPTTLTTAQRQYWMKFMSAGVYAIWREWLFNGQREPLTEIHDLIGGFQTATLQALTVGTDGV